MIQGRRSSYLLLLFAASWTLGCEPQTPAAPATAAQTSGDTKPTEVALPERIVSLAPSVTETVFALGAQDRLVGVTRFCDYPEAAAELPKVGGLTDVDVEVVLSLKPDLVIGVASKTGSGLERTLKNANIEALFLPVETFADVQFSIRELGARVGEPDDAAKLAEAIGAIDVEGAADAPKVLLLFGREPWIAAGANTFGDEMIRRVGGVNALADLDVPYPTLDVERMTTLELDLIIDTSWGSGSKNDLPKKIARDATVVRLDPALIRPGPRLADAMTMFRRAVLAEQAPDPPESPAPPEP